MLLLIKNIILFFILFCSILSLINKNSIYSVLYLVLTFIYVSIFLLLLEVEFIALIFLLVYVGAIAILFLFVVMMLDIKIVNTVKDFFFFFPLGSLFGIILIIELCYIITVNFQFNKYFYLLNLINSLDLNFYFNWLESIEYNFSIQTFGLILYSYFFILVLISGLILLIAILGSVSLTSNNFNQPSFYNKKSQYLFKQINRNFFNSISKKI